MRTRSMLRSGNPSLNSKVFENLERPKNGPLIRDDVMTIQGTVDKTGLTSSEQAFLDDEEKAMTLRNRGMA